MYKDQKQILNVLIITIVISLSFSFYGTVVEINKKNIQEKEWVSVSEPSSEENIAKENDNTREVAASTSIGVVEEEIVHERDELEAIVEEAEEINAEDEEMKAIIKEVFGDHYDKAMLLLTGEGCAENKTLDPNAFNDTNHYFGGKGDDYGLFQINDYWQGVRHQGKAEQFLFDPEINARIAWRIYEDDGYSFKLWTCGRYHEI